MCSEKDSLKNISDRTCNTSMFRWEWKAEFSQPCLSLLRLLSPKVADLMSLVIVVQANCALSPWKQESSHNKLLEGGSIVNLLCKTLSGILCNPNSSHVMCHQSGLHHSTITAGCKRQKITSPMTESVITFSGYFCVSGYFLCKVYEEHFLKRHKKLFLSLGP